MPDSGNMPDSVEPCRNMPDSVEPCRSMPDSVKPCRDMPDSEEPWRSPDKQQERWRNPDKQQERWRNPDKQWEIMEKSVKTVGNHGEISQNSGKSWRSQSNSGISGVHGGAVPSQACTPTARTPVGGAPAMLSVRALPE